MGVTEVSRVCFKWFGLVFSSARVSVTPSLSSHVVCEGTLRWILASFMGNMGLPCLWIWKNCSFAPVRDMMLVREEVSSPIVCALPCALPADSQRPMDTALWHHFPLSWCSRNFLTRHYCGPKHNPTDTHTHTDGLKISAPFRPYSAISTPSPRHLPLPEFPLSRTPLGGGVDAKAAHSDWGIRGIFYDGLIFSPSESGGFYGTTQHIVKNKTKQRTN